MFVRSESFQQYLRFYPVVSTIIAINVAVFLLRYTPLAGFVYNMGIGSNVHIASGEYWRLVTPIFLHGGFAHFLFNSFSLFIFGPSLEVILGSRRFLGLYLFAGIFANLLIFLVGGMGYGLYLGASGAVYGLLGAYLYMILHRPNMIDHQSAQVIKIMLIIGAIYSLLPGISLFAHLFGFGGGFLAAYTMLRPNKPPTRPKKSNREGIKVINFRDRR
ncbi:rhomboid family intramembrane serine protease [Desulfitispora alkaliphila]|uniref:rhomboid family intramembrane serine protease n=1 Tax=Desulfitispora alkaliphila TaxID=622674 RepID=UPI003D2582F5